MHKTLIFAPISSFEICALYVYPVTPLPHPFLLTTPAPICYACDYSSSNSINRLKYLDFTRTVTQVTRVNKPDRRAPENPSLKRERGGVEPSLPQNPSNRYLSVYYLLCSSLPPLPSLPPQTPRKSQRSFQPY